MDAAVTRAAGETPVRRVDETLGCPERGGACPAPGMPAYVIEQNGGRVCAFGSAPKVACRINGSVNTAMYPLKCPETGASIDMVRRKRDSKLLLPMGNWNQTKVQVSYRDPSGRVREQTYTVPMNAPGSTRYKVGGEIPVFYSEKKRKAYLTDWNGASASKFWRNLVGMVLLGVVVDMLTYTNYYTCRLRLGMRVADAGIDI